MAKSQIYSILKLKREKGDKVYNRTGTLMKTKYEHSTKLISLANPIFS